MSSRFESDKTVINDATPGPWSVRTHIGVTVVGPSGHGKDLAVFDSHLDLGADVQGQGWEGKIEDAKFMAQARNRWPQYIRALERIEAVTERQSKGTLRGNDDGLTVENLRRIIKQELG